jgi:hypothetical protein
MQGNTIMDKVKQPDLNAPRFRPIRTSTLGKQFFKRFRKKHPQYKNKNDVELRKIVDEFNTLIWSETIKNRDGVELPENLGYLFVGTCMPVVRKKNIDFSKSIKYNTKLKFKNFESDSYIAKIFYTNYASKYKFKNREVWQFKGDRNFTRTVSATYPENWKMYIQVENFQKINKFYQKSKSRDYFAKKLEIDLRDYNEFDMD